MDWFRELVRTDTGIFWLAISAIVVLPSLIWGVVEIVQAHYRHQERLEMIRHGIHPDTPVKGKTTGDTGKGHAVDPVTSV